MDSAESESDWGGSNRRTIDDASSGNRGKGLSEIFEKESEPPDR